jgi:hypothetical protein
METYTVTVNEYGTKQWHQNGKLHRLDGPAVEWANGDKKWYQNGKLHRLDGPAVECANGHKEWWIEGKRYTEKQFNEKVNPRPCVGKKVVVDGIEYTLS